LFRAGGFLSPRAAHPEPRMLYNHTAFQLCVDVMRSVTQRARHRSLVRWSILAATVIGHVKCRLRLKCDCTRAETIFRLLPKRTSPFKSASVQLTASSRGVRIGGSNAGYTMFRGSVKSTGYPLHSSVAPSLPLPCVTVCHHISTGL